MSHPNAELLKKIYSNLSQDDFKAISESCAEGFKFAVPGKNKLAGTYTASAWASELAPRMKELSGGTFHETVHDILANDQHGCVLASHTLTRKGEKIEYRTCHIWRFTNGKAVARYEYPRDLHQFDAVWG